MSTVLFLFHRKQFRDTHLQGAQQLPLRRACGRVFGSDEFQFATLRVDPRHRCCNCQIKGCFNLFTHNYFPLNRLD